MNQSTEIAKAVARFVEYSASLSRQLGFAFPKEYDLAVRATISGSTVILRVTLQDVVTFPVIALPKNGELKAELSYELAQIGSVLICKYMDKHPELFPEGADAQAQIAELAKNSRANKNHFLEAAEEAYKNAKYEVRGIDATEGPSVRRRGEPEGWER